LGVRLLDRLPRGAVPTAAGSVLLDYAERLAALEDETRGALAELAGLTTGRLAVGASTTIGVYLLPGLLGTFRRDFPGIRLSAMIDNSEVVQRRLIDGSLDLALTEGDPPDVSGIDVSVFRRDELVVIAHPGAPIAQLKRPSAHHLRGVSMILRERGSGTREVVEHALAAAGVGVESTLTLGHTEAIKRAVAAGLGIAVVSALAVDEADGLAIVRPTGLRLKRPLHLLTRTDRTPSPAAARFMELL
jgi:DNA-binding transcriptional LysR family regulator